MTKDIHDGVPKGAISTVFAERWKDYEGTFVRIMHPELGDLEVRPTATRAIIGDFPDPAGRTIHIMTAHNPGVQLSEQDNRHRQQVLVTAVDKMPDAHAWSAIGGDPSWVHTEDSVAIVGLTDQSAVELARRFDQDAIFRWTRTEWTLISCRSEQRHTAGWQLIRSVL